MNRLVVCAALAASVLAAVAANQGSAAAPKDGDGKAKRIDPAKFAAAVYRHTGGRIVRPGTKTGRIVCVDCRASGDKAMLAEAAGSFERVSKVRVEVAEGRFAWPKPVVVGNASLFVVDDAALPSLVSAPEDRWAMVNVAPLRKGRGENGAFFAARVGKELTRGFALLAGAQDSSFRGTLVGCMTGAEQLDVYEDNRLPVDVTKRFANYVRGYGIKPAEEVTYRKACQEGWAPAPTNDVQKAIWDKVHTMPTEPIKIAPEAKKVKD